MKGLFLSIIFLGALVIIVVLSLRIYRPVRPGKIFWSTFSILTPLYFLVYYITPDNCWFITDKLISHYKTIDLLFGFFVFALNFHNFLDFFFAVNGGFSACLALEIMQNQNSSATAEELLNKFNLKGDHTSIQNYRLINLISGGYLIKNQSSAIKLSPKGHLAKFIVIVMDYIMGIRKN